MDTQNIGSTRTNQGVYTQRVPFPIAKIWTVHDGICIFYHTRHQWLVYNAMGYIQITSVYWPLR